MATVGIIVLTLIGVVVGYGNGWMDGKTVGRLEGQRAQVEKLKEARRWMVERRRVSRESDEVLARIEKAAK